MQLTTALRRDQQEETIKRITKPLHTADH
jgi:hypothetical protein